MFYVCFPRVMALLNMETDRVTLMGMMNPNQQRDSKRLQWMASMIEHLALCVVKLM